MGRPTVTAEQERFGRALGSELQRSRGARSAREVAEDAGVGLDTIRKLERGVIASPGFHLVGQLAAALSVSLDTLFSTASGTAASERGD